jgi:undecaprenyl-diphosphatase
MMLEALLGWDERLFRLINEGWLHPVLDHVMPLVTDARNYLIPFMLAGIVILYVGRLRGVRFLILATVSVVVADAISAHVFKQAFLRVRPCIALEGVRQLVGCVNSPSFPSNHAANAAALATLAALSMPRLWTSAVALAMLVGYSRIYVGTHYPLDVLAGGVLGLAIALVLSGIMTLLWPFDSGPGERRRLFALNFGDR